MKQFLFHILFIILLVSCNKNNDRFRELESSATGVEFNNSITESDSLNILTYEYIFNGGGVGIEDFNNDGLLDLFFTGNMVESKLYLNKGDLNFKDVTADSQINTSNNWCSAVAIADVNGDGWKDIYICVTANPDPLKRENFLYVNKGLSKDGVPLFENQAKAYGVNDCGHSSAAAFFDYDKDGDLDLFIANNRMTDNKSANVYKSKEQSIDRIDKLYRNDEDSVTGKIIFHDVSMEAGIIYEGYSLAVNVSDINDDSWPDIYVTNDYLTNDLVYINKGNGRFENQADHLLKHTSHSAMGNDVVDLNNDGQLDIIAVDMLPEDNFRRKTMLGPNNYTNYINNDKYGYQYQYIRNTLQLNQGFGPNQLPVFSDVSLLAGISSTDWSWTPLVADFDNDGLKDIIITNGFPRDVTDRDFVEYYSEVSLYAPKSMLIESAPSVKITNYAYKNLNGIEFANVTESWGIKHPSFSNGAAYGDLDNDGDLDYVVNNINEEASIFENMSSQNFKDSSNYLKIKLVGDSLNSGGFGSKIYLYREGEVQFTNHTPFRGYLSSSDPFVFYGLGAKDKIDSIKVIWPDDKISIIKNVVKNTFLEIKKSQGTTAERKALIKSSTLLKEIDLVNSNDVSNERDYIDFNVQPLLLHKFSQQGPGIAVGDVDNNGLDDFYIGGSYGYPGSYYSQVKNDVFEKTELFASKQSLDREELGLLFFDADSDGDLDLYSARGGYEFESSNEFYTDLLFENKGGKLINSSGLPELKISSSCVRAADFDRDGDLDLFVGGRVTPQKFPMPTSSYLLVNNSADGKISFEVTAQSTFENFGMVTDAVWTDFNNDGWIDLIVVGELMPIRIFKNNNGILKELDNNGIQNKLGCWNSIASGDFDMDGDQDYIVGNLGLNTLLKVSEEEPLTIYSGDFDQNGTYDFIPTIYFKNSAGKKGEYPFFGRLDVQKEIIKVKKQFLKHAQFGEATIDKILSPEIISKAAIYKANYLKSSVMINKGGDTFELMPLPLEAQFSPINGILIQDFNNDNFLDFACIGNDYGVEVSMGRMDAFNGLIFLGNGHAEFTNAPSQLSGFCIQGDAKGLSSIVNNNGKEYLIGTQNRGPIKSFLREFDSNRVLNISSSVFLVEIILENGRVIKNEVPFGSGYLSQSSRRVIMPANVSKIILHKFNGEEIVKNF